MKVIHLDLGKEWRGGQRQVYYLIAEQTKHTKHTNLQLFLASPPNSPLSRQIQQNFSWVKIIPLSSRFEFSIFNVIALKKIIDPHKPVIVHTHDGKGAGLGAVLKLFFPHIRLIHTRRVSYPLKNFWSKKKYLLADWVVGVSKDICSYLQQIGVEKTSCIPSVIKPELYPLRTKPYIQEIPVKLGIIGALSPQKGHEWALHALASCPLDFVLYVVGTGCLEKRLKELVRILNLTEKVKFLGFVESKQILSKLDVLLVPSIDGEGSSGTIKEAWASKVAVIASDLKANLELISPNQDGLVVPVGDSFALQAALKRLIQDKAFYSFLVKNGLAKVQNYVPSKMEESYFKLYNSLFLQVS